MNTAPPTASERCTALLAKADRLCAQDEWSKACQAYWEAEAILMQSGFTDIDPRIQADLALLSTRVGISHAESAVSLIRVIKRITASHPDFDLTELDVKLNEMSTRLRIYSSRSRALS